MPDTYDTAGNTPDPDDLPFDVAELFARGGEWINTRPGAFYFDCVCGRKAVCRCARGPKEDRWLSHCATKRCERHGEIEVSKVVVDDATQRERKQFGREFEAAAAKMYSELDDILLFGAQVNSPDTDDAALLDTLCDDVISRYVLLSRDEAIVTTLWVVHTWCLPAARFTPYIHLRSALPREGKSVLLDIMKYVVARPYVVTDPTPAAIAKRTEIAAMMGMEPPTFLWDEIDSAYQRWQSLREYVNAGYERGTSVIRQQGRDKPTFGPKMMAGLTDLPPTVADRSFRFDMMRAKRSERPVPLRPAERRELEAYCHEIRLRLEAFAMRYMDLLMEGVPDDELPNELDDRAQAVAEPLLAIADIAGGDWPEKARTAMVNIRRDMQANEAEDMRMMLLADIKTIFGPFRQRIYSETLAEKLCNMPDRPWKANRLTVFKMSRELSEFREYRGGPRLKPRKMRIGGRPNPLKATFERKQFVDLWERYLTPPEKQK